MSPSPAQESWDFLWCRSTQPYSVCSFLSRPPHLPWRWQPISSPCFCRLPSAQSQLCLQTGAPRRLWESTGVWRGHVSTLASWRGSGHAREGQRCWLSPVVSHQIGPSSGSDSLLSGHTVSHRQSVLQFFHDETCWHYLLWAPKSLLIMISIETCSLPTCQPQAQQELERKEIWNLNPLFLLFFFHLQGRCENLLDHHEREWELISNSLQAELRRAWRAPARPGEPKQLPYGFWVKSSPAAAVVQVSWPSRQKFPALASKDCGIFPNQPGQFRCHS